MEPSFKQQPKAPDIKKVEKELELILSAKTDWGTKLRSFEKTIAPLPREERDRLRHKHGEALEVLAYEGAKERIRRGVA